MSDNLTPTKHAVIQSLMSLADGRKTHAPCCVPTKLDPIALLYVEKGVPTYKFKYEGMVVKECGCR